MPTINVQQAFVDAIQHHQAGRLREAEALYRQIVAQHPNHADAMQMLGVLANDYGDAATAVDLIRRAIAIDPCAPQYQGNLGMVLAGQGKLPDAIAAYRAALAILPQYPEARTNLALALVKTGDLDEAIVQFHTAIALRPDHEDAYIGLGNALWAAGQLDEAIASYRRATALQPCSKAWHNILWALHFCPEYDGGRLLQEHRRWAADCADHLVPTALRYDNSRDPNRRLRVGYVSPDFIDHPVSRFLLPLLENRDREEFEAFCYSDVPHHDAMTQRLRSNTDVWRDTAPMTDDQLAGTIRQDRIDILVDLALHTGGRMLVFARKPAPVQVSYLGYCSTTGLKTMDYRLTDPYLDPPGAGDEDYSERSVRLPHSYWCYQAPAEAAPVGPLPFDKNGYVAFGCLNSFRKVTAVTLALWCRILREVPDSKLMIHSYNGSHRQRAREYFTLGDIDPSRIDFIGTQAAEQYFKLYNQIDIALDPCPYAGGTTTCDALWMGVPVVSLKGRTAISRAGFSILSNVGAPELMADTPDQYVQIAAALARDLSRLGEYRSSLRQRMRASPLMNTRQFTRDLEDVFHRMWLSNLGGFQ